VAVSSTTTSEFRLLQRSILDLLASGWPASEVLAACELLREETEYAGPVEEIWSVCERHLVDPVQVATRVEQARRTRREYSSLIRVTREFWALSTLRE
jgi:hypothetical protein